MNETSLRQTKEVRFVSKLPDEVDWKIWNSRETPFFSGIYVKSSITGSANKECEQVGGLHSIRGKLRIQWKTSSTISKLKKWVWIEELENLSEMNMCAVVSLFFNGNKNDEILIQSKRRLAVTRELIIISYIFISSILKLLEIKMVFLYSNYCIWTSFIHYKLIIHQCENYYEFISRFFHMKK